MSTQLPYEIDSSQAKGLPAGSEIEISDAKDGTLVEKVSMVRYAGHYRDSGINAFVVRDSRGKIKVRSEGEMGLDPASGRVARLTSSPIDLTESANAASPR